ncbi:polysaccharide biosynthesis/export family protein [Parasediminibacterium sp. JCM 36343]|uniref:polysaccharide biosynthesis/export family protein n=1 Tax=Parasediminibacterium sp. JCM 36343 TaxID=3374279 RepID=UPI00397DBED2
MKHFISVRGFDFLLILLVIVFFPSCRTYKNIPYFKDVPDSTSINVKTAEFYEPLIQYDDIILISINTLDAASASGLGLGGGVSGSGNSGAGAASMMSSGSTTAITLPGSSSYRVDKTGTIDMPLIGKLTVSGLTTSKVKDLVQAKVSEYYKSPAVDVRFANFHVTVLGEVAKPSTYVFANEKVSVLDALGQAGDLTIFGKRENVLLIRDSAGVKQLTRINLNSKFFLSSSSSFFLKQNDVIYVEPVTAKIANLDAAQTKNYTILTAIISLLIVISTRIR